jgi:DNA invertase Pin-like site-specific DNA recombinase
MIGNLIAYYRVSTDKQGVSGLGLEAQRKAVLDYLNGGRWKLVAELTEVETGKNADRPKLAEALALCKVYKAKLIIAKLDRLARNVAFISNLMEAGVEFLAVDFPQANRLTVHILAAVAEHEAAMISARTKAALEAAKARGVRLGNPDGFARVDIVKGRQLGLAARRTQSTEFRNQMMPIIQGIKVSGITTVRGITDELNRRGIPTMRGRHWSATQVFRVIRTA